MKKLLLASVITALALPAMAAETTTITTTSPELTTTTTTTQAPQQMEEAAPVSEPSTAPAVDAFPETGAGTLDQQRMEDPAVDTMESGYRALPETGKAQEMQDPSVEDESGEFKPKIDDIDYE